MTRFTPPRRRAWTEEDVEQRLGGLLRAGVLLAALVVTIGAVVYLARHGGEPTHYRLFVGEPHELRGVLGVIRQAESLSGRGILQLGVLLLIATPVARVVFAALAFARARDRLYVGVSLIVLAILLVSLTGVVV